MTKIVLEVGEILTGDPKETARHIAAAFYRELRRGGLTETDVITVASELLRCLNATLNDYQEKLER